MVAVEHRREAPPKAAVEQLHVGVGPEGGEYLLALPVAELVEGELVVVAHERRPLAVRRDGGVALEGCGQRPGVAAGQGQVHGLHHREAEEQLQLVALLVAEELAQRLRR